MKFNLTDGIFLACLLLFVYAINYILALAGEPRSLWLMETLGAM